MSVETGGEIPARIKALLDAPAEPRPSREDRLRGATLRARAHLKREGCIVIPFQGDEPLVAPQSWNCACGLYGIPAGQNCTCGNRDLKR